MKVRDRIIANLAVEGKTNRQIAEILGLSYQTVCNRMRSVYREVGLTGPGAGGSKRRQLKAKLAEKPRVEI